MSGSAVIGALHVVLDADNDNFDQALDHSRDKIGQLEVALSSLTDKLREAGAKITTVGVGMAAAFSASMAVISTTAFHSASDIETAMRRLNVALGTVSSDQLKALEDQAKTLGESMGRSGSDSAAAMADLANAGMRASDILGGGFAASLKLAAIGQSELGPATELTSDLIRTFSLDAAKLGPTLDKVTGALLTGHGGFDAYKQAVSGAGDAAVTAGMSFADFNTTVAALGAVLHKGADAGGSMKEFLSKLADPSDIAKQEMKDLGAAFYDAAGKLKPMADIAEVLRQKFAGLSEQTRSKVFTEMFGGSGMETAIALMREGKKGFLDLQATIGNASADKQAAASQDGYAAAMARLGAAFQNLKIAIGEAGLVQLLTSIANAATSMVHLFEGIAPAFYQVGAACTAVADAMGPLLVIVGGALYLAFGFWLRTLGPIGWAISALIEPIGTLIAGLRVLAMEMVTMEGAGALASAAFGALLTPLGLVTIAVGALVYAWYQQREAQQASLAEQDRLRTTMDGAKPAIDKAAEAIEGLTGKTGEAAKAARDHADAMLKEAEAAVVVAQAAAADKRRTADNATGAANSYRKSAQTYTGGASMGGGGSALVAAGAMDDQASMRRAEAAAAEQGASDAVKRVAALREKLAAPPPKPIAYTPPSGKKDSGPDDSTKKEKHGPTPEDLRLAKEIEAAQLRGDLDIAQKLQDQLALNKQIEAYQRAGLGLDAARTAAQRDMAAVTAARLITEQKAIDQQERSVAIEVAQIDQNYRLQDSLERQANILRLIDFYKSQEMSETAARAAAEKDQAARDAALARQRQRWLSDDRDSRALTMAQARGDSEEQIRQLQRVIDVTKRARDLEQNERMTPDDARALANREADQERAAQLQGQFRDIFKGGFKAAMDGSTGEWFKNWWQDKVQRGLEGALNNLADAIAKLFSHAADGATGTGGGILSAIGSALGLATSKSHSGVTGITAPDIHAAVPDLGNVTPAFATGGSFKVGGRSGIDQNLVSMRLSKGEMVDIRRPGNDNGAGGGRIVNQTINMQGGVDLATRNETYRLAGATKAATMAAIDDAGSRRG